MQSPPNIEGPCRSALKIAVVTQAAILILTSLLLDGGVLFQICFYGFIAFWAGAGTMIIRRGTELTAIDLMVIRSGSLPACVLSWLVCWTFWR